jgi:hypothetical protein
MELPWLPAAPLDAGRFAEVRHAAIFDCCKWDPQVEDVCTLSPQPLVLTAAAWQEIATLAEQLATETVAAEAAILAQPHLLKRLALPWSLSRRLARMSNPSQPSRHLRLIRFDFHFTTDGWKISEANSDVPGGFNEASGFSKLMAMQFPGMVPPGDPAEKLASAITANLQRPGTVALLHATAFSDDRQVMTFLSRKLSAAGHTAVLAAPDHLRWEDDHAYLDCEWAQGKVDFCFRFFPAEWLPALPRRCGWQHLLGGCRTPLCNPASGIISQSKRFPLVWGELPISLPTWNRLLPRTMAVCELSRHGLKEDAVVFKPALGRVGDMIKMAGVTGERETRVINRSLRWHPKHWIAQQRFEAIPLSTPDGPVFPCIGVYTLDGEAIGAYGRSARRPLIDHLAQDAAVLIADPGAPSVHDVGAKHDSIATLPTLGAG